MKVSYNWLKEYLEFQESPEEIGEILTQTGLEVESIELVSSIPGGLKGVVVGEVLECQKHPDADKLKITSVSVGSEILPIVCGASNVGIGQKVAVATVGTTIHPLNGDPLLIKSAKIRGVVSQGMLCAEDELGLGNSHDGIIILDSEARIGSPLASILKLEQDYVLEIGLTPNRSDALGHIGVARDLKAFFNFHHKRDLSISWPKIKENISLNKSELSIQLIDQTACPQYFAAKINNVKVGPSPEWLVKRLATIGVNSINNIVDVTNFVMRELGTPLHAFDANCFQKEIVVRFAKEGESLKTLDSVDRKLSNTDLVIANSSSALCIAGVMGGLESGVSSNTQNILLESAYFNPTTIRKTAKFHGINSDASFRFERGVDPDLTETALNRAIDLILEIAGGNLEVTSSSVNNNWKHDSVIEVDCNRINKDLGTSLQEDQIHSIMKSLDFVKLDANKWRVPLYRTDVKRHADLVEEIIRIVGFDNVPIPEKWQFSVPFSEIKTPESLRSNIAQFLVGNACNEVMNNSLTKASYCSLLEDPKFGKPVELLNPLSNDLGVMRNSLFFGLLETVAHNQNRQNPNLKIFEFGQTYACFANKYVEKAELSIVFVGKKRPDSWLGAEPTTFYALKGMIYQMIQSITDAKVDENSKFQHPLFDDVLELKVNGKSLAFLGQISKKVAKSMGIKQEVFGAQIDWKAWLNLSLTTSDVYKGIPKSFEVRRDFSFLVDSSISYQMMKQTAFSCCSNLLKEINLFDVYEEESLEQGKKSYALSFYFQDYERTLTDTEVDHEMGQIRTQFEKTFQAILR